MVLLVKGTSGKYESKPLPPLPVKETLRHVKEDGNDVWFAGENGHLILYSKTTHRFSPVPNTSAPVLKNITNAPPSDYIKNRTTIIGEQTTGKK